MSAIIQLTFDGALTRNRHQVTMRDLAQVMTGLQSAADRACLDVYHGNVWKHQKLRRAQYEMVEFIVGQPQEGSYLIDFLSTTAGHIVERMKRALQDPYANARAEGDRQIYAIGHQIAGKKDAARVPRNVITYEELEHTNNPLITRTYGDRSINKEFGQMLNPLAREPDGFMRLVLKPFEDEGSYTFDFDNQTAKKFKKIISERQLGGPVLYEGRIRELDRGTEQMQHFRGKFINSYNNKTIILHIESEADFASLVPFLGKDEPIKIIAAPIVEFASFDPTGGDIQFLQIDYG